MPWLLLGELLLAWIALSIALGVAHYYVKAAYRRWR